MAMVEYLLRLYAEYSAKTEKARKKNDDFEYAYEDDAGDYIFAKFDEDGETKEVAIFYAPFDEKEYKNGLCITLVELW